MNTDRLRRLLLGVFVLGLLGTSVALLLLEHFETWRQWLPLALLGLGLLAAVRVGTSPGRRSLAGLRVVAIAFILSGFLGIYFHMKSNFEFERELDSSVHGFRLVGEALANVLDEAGRESLYRVAWIPIDLNSASREEILLIPGVGDRMAREFEEYRPYTAMAQFRREIGKYVDDAEVERLAQYVTIPASSM